jgi:hypothetical protein
MKGKAALALLVLALGSAALPASAQSRSRYDLAPGALVNLVMRLYRPVAVDLRDASVGQAARAASEAARVPISVDARVAAGARVTLSARGVPLAVVLEQVAQQANVLIAPVSSTKELLNRTDQALRLVPAPSLQAGGAPTAATPYAPWSTEWGLDPASGAFPSAAEAAGSPTGGPGGGAGARF